MFNGSYRTYEEWKHKKRTLIDSVEVRSYRTYEEWKHTCKESKRNRCMRSYRTYEEWKHRLYFLIALLAFPVLTVPMRNGNSISIKTVYKYIKGSYRTYEEWKLYCEVEKTDDGISSYRTYEEWKHEFFVSCHFFYEVLTVPMRNGNTIRIPPFQATLISSYRTYEEWKLSYKQAPWKVSRVLTVPMRNGNNRRHTSILSLSKFLPYL